MSQSSKIPNSPALLQVIVVYSHKHASLEFPLREDRALVDIQI